MKIIYIFLISVLAGQFNIVFADQYTSANKALEEGLFELKKSSQQILQKNIVLEKENNLIREKIIQASEELELLRLKEQEVLVQTQNEKMQSNFDEKVEGKQKTIGELELDLAYLKDEAHKLSDLLEKRQRHQTSLVKDIEQAQQNVNRHSVDINQLSQALKVKRSHPRLGRLQKIKAKKEDSIDNLTKELARVEKGYEKPLKALEVLQKENGFLTQQLASTRESYSEAVKEAKVLGDALIDMKKANLEKVSQITERIALLSQEKEEIVKVLMVAEEKLGTKKVDVASVQRSAQFLKENLAVIREENDLLKNEYSKLSNALDAFKD